MFSQVKNFVSRHKKKFIVTGIVIGGTVIAIRFAQRKIREFQESQGSDLIEKARRSCHFDSTEQTCNQTIMSLAPNVFEIVLKACDTDSILELIKLNPENKLELWDELKILSFARITTLVYASSILVITLRIQLNLLGGYLYKDTTQAESKITNDIQQAYLSLVEHYIRDGVNDLYKLIEINVRKILKNYTLKQKLTLSDIEQIFWSIQMAINSDDKDPNSNIAKFVLPKKLNNENDLLNKMFSETLDFLESDEVSCQSSNNVSRGFSQVIDNLAEFYAEPSTTTNNNNNNNNTSLVANTRNGIAHLSKNVPSTSKGEIKQFIDINQNEIQLAKLIPIMNVLGSKGINNTIKPPSLSTSLFTLYLISDKIKMLGANVYEVFSQ